jgi:hypothetical protein
MEIPFLMNIAPRRDCGTADHAGKRRNASGKAFGDAGIGQRGAVDDAATGFREEGCRNHSHGNHEWRGRHHAGDTAHRAAFLAGMIVRRLLSGIAGVGVMMGFRLRGMVMPGGADINGMIVRRMNAWLRWRGMHGAALPPRRPADEEGNGQQPDNRLVELRFVKSASHCRAE